MSLNAETLQTNYVSNYRPRDSLFIPRHVVCFSFYYSCSQNVALLVQMRQKRKFFSKKKTQKEKTKTPTRVKRKKKKKKKKTTILVVAGKFLVYPSVTPSYLIMYLSLLFSSAGFRRVVVGHLLY